MVLNDLLMEALKLMGIGMLCVGAFLGALVLLIPLLNKIVPDEVLPESVARQSAVTTSKNTALDEGVLLAVISAAVRQYRNNTTKP